MTSKLFWLGSALGAALLANGCSSSTDNGDGGTTTTTTGASTTGHGTTTGTTGQATTTGGGSTTTTTTGGTTTTTAGTTGTTTTTTTTTTGGSTTGTGTTTTGGSTTTTTTTGGTTGGSMIGTACLTTANPDTTCAPSGYYCMATDNLGNGTCQIPIEFFPCLDSVGCATGLTCTAGFVDNNNNPISICVQQCTATLDCLDPITACIPGQTGSSNICFYNPCGGTSGNGDGAYLSCNSAGTNDGTCLPPFGDATLECQQAGPVASYQPCGNTRANGDVATLCVEGDTCTTFGGTATACLQICPTGAPTFPDGGPGCADGFDCLTFGANLGICLQQCLDSSTCPSPLTCQNFGAPSMYCAP